MSAFARDADRVNRPGSWTNRNEAHIADADETQRFAQIGRRHVDAAAVHAGDAIAAACLDHDRLLVLELGLVSLRRFKPERQSVLRYHGDPLYQLIGVS